MVTPAQSFPLGPSIAPTRLIGALYSLRTPSTRPPFSLGGISAQQSQNLLQLQERLTMLAERASALLTAQSGLSQAIVDLSNIRDIQLPLLSTLTTFPTADAFDTARNAIDVLLDKVEPIGPTLLTNPSAVRTALEDARNIINGTRGVIGDANYYDRFTRVNGADPAILPNVIANFDATNAGSTPDPDVNGAADQLLDSPFGAVANDATAPNDAAEPLITSAPFGNVAQSLLFDGVDDILNIAGDTVELETDVTGQRTFLLAFQTGADVATPQVIYDQAADANSGGTVGEGFTILIEGGQLKLVIAADADAPRRAVQHRGAGEHRGQHRLCREFHLRPDQRHGDDFGPPERHGVRRDADGFGRGRTIARVFSISRIPGPRSAVSKAALRWMVGRPLATASISAVRSAS